MLVNPPTSIFCISTEGLPGLPKKQSLYIFQPYTLCLLWIAHFSEPTNSGISAQQRAIYFSKPPKALLAVCSHHLLASSAERVNTYHRSVLLSNKLSSTQLCVLHSVVQHPRDPDPYSPGSYRHRLARPTATESSSLIKPSISLVDFCSDWTLVIGLVIRRGGQSRPHRFYHKVEALSTSSSNKTGRRGSHLQAQRDWCLKVFAHINLNVPSPSLRVSSFPNKVLTLT